MIRRSRGRGIQNDLRSSGRMPDRQIYAAYGPETENCMIRHSLILAVAFTATLTLNATCRSAESIPANIAAAVADSTRPDADKQRDPDR